MRAARPDDTVITVSSGPLTLEGAEDLQAMLDLLHEEIDKT